MRLRVGLAVAMLLASGTVEFAQTKEAPVKKPICGLVTMGDLGFLGKGSTPGNTFPEANRHPDVYAGVVILAQWKQLEPERGKFDFAMIENAMNNIKKYNAAHPQHPLVGKLRVFAASGTPEWVLKLDGGPLKMIDRRGTETIGIFWGKEYGDAWRELQAALAAKYDDNPLMGEVAISSCSSTTAEPFVIFLNPENMPALHKAGYTDAKIKSCLMGAIDDYAVWKKTPLDYTLNGFRDSDSGKNVADPGFTADVAKAFRAKYGTGKAVLANHGLDAPLKPYDEVLDIALLKLGPPIEYQTIAPNVDWNATFAMGLKYGVTEMETWNSKDAGGPSQYTMADLVNWNKALGCPAR